MLGDNPLPTIVNIVEGTRYHGTTKPNCGEYDVQVVTSVDLLSTGFRAIVSSFF